MGKLISVIGAGGKTTTLLALARAAKGKRVLLTTTTHIYPVRPPDSRVYLENPKESTLLKSLSQPGIVCAGSLSREGKLSALEPSLLLKAAAAGDLTVCEADGAHMHPLKLHREGEPVIPPCTDRCVLLAGLSAYGKPVSQVIHRWERNLQWREAPEKSVSREEMLYCILEGAKKSGLPREKIFIVLNQLDSLPDPGPAEWLAERLSPMGYSAMAGSMESNPDPLTAWILE